jgi:uncharacterized protein (TIGR03437 family)
MKLSVRFATVRVWAIAILMLGFVLAGSMALYKNLGSPTPMPISNKQAASSAPAVVQKPSPAIGDQPADPSRSPLAIDAARGQRVKTPHSQLLSLDSSTGSEHSKSEKDELFRTKLPTEGTAKSDEDDGEAERREDWFYRQRAYPEKTIPLAAGSRMVEQLEREEIRLKDLRASATELALEPEQTAVWAALGPQPIISGQTFGGPRNNVSGRISAIALDPRYNGTTNQTLYVGGAQGGLWRSIDNGANWIPLTDGQPSLAMGAIAIDPNNPNIIFAGTGESSSCGTCYYGAGLLKSTDGGSTWTVITGPIASNEPRIPAFLNVGFTRIVIDPTNSSTIFACTGATAAANANSEPQLIEVGQVGVWKSTDGGSTWRNVDPSNTNGQVRGHDLIIDPQNNNRVFAAMRSTGVFRSESGGEPGTWQRLTGGLPAPGDPLANSTFRRINLASGPPIPPSTNTTLYAAYATTGSRLLGIWRSTNLGNTWIQVTNPPASGQTNYNLDITADPIDSNIVYYGTSTNGGNNGGTLWRSRNGGQTWEDLSRGDSIGGGGGLHADTHQIVIDPTNPNILFTGNDGGIWRTNNARDNIVSWAQLNNKINITQFMSIALHPTDPNFLIGGTQDNGTNIFRGDLAWDHSDDGDGGFALIDQSNPQVMYHTYFNQSGSEALIGPAVSEDGGNDWNFVGCSRCTAQAGRFNPTDRVAFYAPMALNTGFTGPNGNVVYFGTHRLYRSVSRGSFWTGLGASGDGFGADLTKGLGVISTIAAHPQLNNSTTPPGEIVWVGTSDGNIQITTNAGNLENATFTNLTKAPLPNRHVSDIALDPANPQRAVATFSGFNTNTPATPGHVFLTTNRGDSWINMSGNLPDVPVTSVALNPNNINTMYIGTDLGVFQTTDGGATWLRLGNGMPRVATFMVRYHAPSNSLVAATHGRGVFRLTAARALATVSAGSFSASSIATESIVAAFGSGLATTTSTATSLPLPTSLAGTKVVVRDGTGVERLSPLFFVASSQVNFQIPPGTTAGSATITITGGDGIVSSGVSEIATVAPSLFSANASGKGVAAGYALRFGSSGSHQLAINRFDGGQNAFVSVPIDLGSATDRTFLVLFGTGFRFRSTLSNVTATIGGVNAPVLFAGAQGDFVGLDQCNIEIPRSLFGRGEVDLVLSVDGKPANTLHANIK